MVLLIGIVLMPVRIRHPILMPIDIRIRNRQDGNTEFFFLIFFSSNQCQLSLFHLSHQFHTCHNFQYFKQQTEIFSKDICSFIIFTFDLNGYRLGPLPIGCRSDRFRIRLHIANIRSKSKTKDSSYSTCKPTDHKIGSIITLQTWDVKYFHEIYEEEQRLYLNSLLRSEN